MSPQIKSTGIDRHAPGLLKTIKRNGNVVAYDDNKIKVAIAKAFIAEEGGMQQHQIVFISKLKR